MRNARCISNVLSPSEDYAEKKDSTYDLHYFTFVLLHSERQRLLLIMIKRI
ncbi:MAG: hypothetical protein Q8K92_04030 [Leadbetterella sp.]|nr:hypothetical protein [Leadbetterella sp.]